MEKRITSFRDLEVYQNTYTTCIKVMTEILPKLPDSEKYDLKDQLSRSVKAIPRLIAEGYVKRHQKSGFQKYLDDAMAECNETIVGLEMCRDIYGKAMIGFSVEELIDLYDKTGRQLYNLAKAWSKFKHEKPNR
ncbi:MAG: four helix bundle protein [Nitrospirae bacterium]|nr:four helix bundle protein [Nitrospirota bacterium]